MEIETTPLKRRQVRSAIALSNVGVRLLELQCYAQAVDCLNEATILVGANGGSTGEDAVNRCLRHLSSPRPASKQVLLFEVLTTTPDGFEQGDASALESVLDGAPSSFMGFPVRLEDSSNVATKAILAHNHGIACYCLSRTLQKSHPPGEYSPLRQNNQYKRPARDFNNCLLASQHLSFTAWP
jgi:hypothetical protein